MKVSCSTAAALLCKRRPLSSMAMRGSSLSSSMASAGSACSTSVSISPSAWLACSAGTMAARPSLCVWMAAYSASACPTLRRSPRKASVSQALRPDRKAS
ncbi:hypothetical protein D3C71_1581990 [compost metagenome]